MVHEELLFGIDDVLERVAKSRPVQRRSQPSRNSSTGEMIKEMDEEEDDDSVKQELTPTKTTPNRKRKRSTSPIPTSAKGVLVCAVDFGMTYSGLAFSDDKAKPSEVTCMNRYPGSREVRSKVSTVIAYSEENRDHPKFTAGGKTNADESRFGFEVDTRMVRHAFYKKALDNRDEDEDEEEEAASIDINADADTDADFDDPILEQESMARLLHSSTGPRGLQAIRDSLYHLYQIMMSKIAAELGDDFLERYTLKVVLTHPAAMRLRSIAKLRARAEASGWTSTKDSTLVLRSEPDAAITAAFVANAKKFGAQAWLDAFQSKSGVTVMDIGGYTADSSTFVVKKNDPNIEIDQLCTPQGGKCGTVALYCRLYQYLADLFGEHFTSIPETAIGQGSQFLKKFEDALGEYDGTASDAVIYPVDLVMKDLEHDKYDDIDGTIKLEGLEIKAIMDESLKYIKSILDHQFRDAEKFRKKVKTVVLCGGGSLFPYYYNQLKAFCTEHETGPKILVQPDDPQSAVSVGALISCLQTRVLRKRRSRAAYGVKVHRKFVPGSWSKKDIFHCQYGNKRVNGFMEWHVLKGDIIDPEKPGSGKTVPGYSVIDMDDLDNIHHKRVTIYSYSGDDETPPDRVNHTGVRKVGSFIVNLSAMSPSMKQKLKKKCGSSRTTKVELKLVQLINVESGLIEFEARVGNTIIGRYQLDFDATYGE